MNDDKLNIIINYIMKTHHLIMVLVLIIILYAIYSYKSECQDPYGLVSEPIFRANSNMSGGAGEP